MTWDIVLAALVGVCGAITFGAAINQRRRGGNVLSVLFFVGVTVLAIAVTIYRINEYWSGQGGPVAEEAGRPGVTTPPALSPSAGPVEGSGAAPTPTEIVYGKGVAERMCAGCHQISPGQPAPSPVVNARTGSSVVAPSFAAIASDPHATAASLRGYLKLPHYPMPDQSLPAGDVPYLTAYILSLRNADRLAR